MQMCPAPAKFFQRGQATVPSSAMTPIQNRSSETMNTAQVLPSGFRADAAWSYASGQAGFITKK